jgi:hypothetical protein
MASRLRKLAYGSAIVGSGGLFANWIWDDLHSKDRVSLKQNCTHAAIELELVASVLCYIIVP